jgi:broad specificity phosphatase PhoE
VRGLRSAAPAMGPFAAIYASPLQRAWETAGALAAAGLGPLRACPELKEIDCGCLDGLPLVEVKRRFPALWAANVRQDDEQFRWPEGESYRELRARALRAVHRLALAHRGARIGVVTHAGVIGQIFGALAGVSPARWECFRPGNATLSEIEWSRGTATVVRFDDRTHLAQLQ